MRRSFIWLTWTLMSACVAGLVLRAQAREMPPAWPYAQPQLPPGEVPPQAAASSAPGPAAPPSSTAPGQVLRQAIGSALQFTQQQVNYAYGPADWFPTEHPPMPDIVAHGKVGSVRACALCHLVTGRGRPENAPVQHLPIDYFVAQLHDFQAGVRHSADPRKANTLAMEDIAKALTESEITAAAQYFNAIPPQQYLRVVETDTVPTTHVQNEIYFANDDGQKEPIGARVMEVAENTDQTQLRNPKSGFVVYAPIGSVTRGKALAATGGNGRTLACATCHGPDFKGIAPVPSIAGRSPSYLARQLYDMKIGTRHGPMAVLMKPVVANLTNNDVVDLTAFLSSLDPK